MRCAVKRGSEAPWRGPGRTSKDQLSKRLRRVLAALLAESLVLISSRIAELPLSLLGMTASGSSPCGGDDRAVLHVGEGPHLQHANTAGAQLPRFRVAAAAVRCQIGMD